MLDRLNLRVRILLFFAALAGGANVAVAIGLFLAYRRLDAPELLPAFEQVGLVAGLVILGLVTWIWYLFDANVALPIIRLASKLRARAHARIDGGIEEPTARYLGDLAPAASATALTLAETRDALAESVARETSRLSSEKARLEALLSDVPVGLLLCSGDHQLVFYNGPATDLMNTAGAPGLDRNLFDYLRDGPIRHAHRRLIEAGDPDAASDILCTTVVGARVLAARMRLIGGETTKPGYVLTLRDVTSALASYARREALLAEVFDRIRRPAANLQTLFEVLPPGSCPPPDMDRALRQEAAGLAAAVTELGARHDESRHDGWPLSLTRASDLLDGLHARMEQAGLSAEIGEAPLLPALQRLRGDRPRGDAGRPGGGPAHRPRFPRDPDRGRHRGHAAARLARRAAARGPSRGLARRAARAGRARGDGAHGAFDPHDRDLARARGGRRLRPLPAAAHRAPHGPPPAAHSARRGL